MPTKELAAFSSEFPQVWAHRGSRPDALEAWREFLRPRKLEVYRLVRDESANTLQVPQHTSRALERKSSKKWTDDEFMEFALAHTYPDDIEDRVEQSWQR